VRIYDLAGREVRVLVDAVQKPGVYTAVWDGLTGAGDPAARGVYFIRLTAEGVEDARKVVLVR
jgi:hypothetical protein